MPVPPNVIVLVLLVEIFSMYFYIIFSNVCEDIFIKVSVSAIINWPSAKRRAFVALFLAICNPFIFSVFRCESMSFRNMFSGVGERDSNF